jgi:hypothetical protein
MKKQLLMPFLIAVLAVGSAVASNRFAAGYYESGDITCTGTPSEEPFCTLGNDDVCRNGEGQPYKYKVDPTDPGSPCLDVIRAPLP